MSTEAMRVALESAESVLAYCSNVFNANNFTDRHGQGPVIKAALDQVRAALAQPVAPATRLEDEPAALTDFERGYEEALNDCVQLGVPWARNMLERTGVVVAPTVLAYVPLSDEAITRIWFESASGKITPTYLEFARALEALVVARMRGEGK